MLGSECMAISRLGVCPDCAATLTAPLFERSGGVEWRPFVAARELRDTEVFFAIEEARVHLAAGDLEEAETSVMFALMLDRDSAEAFALLEEIDLRRGDL